MSDKKSAMAAVATGFLNDIILERYLIKILPKNRLYSLKTIKKLTGYDFLSFRKYVKSELFTVNKTSIEITDNAELLNEKSKNYCETLIKKLVNPSQYKHNNSIYDIGKLYNNSYFTSEEKSFIDLMLDNLNCIINDDIAIRLISKKDLLNVYAIYDNGFNCVARDIINAIIQNEIHAGDNIMPLITCHITDNKDISDKLDSCLELDYLFNKNAILKCDLNSNVNILIKNFLNLIIYNLKDVYTKMILLLKLNSKYSLLIRDKVFCDFE